MVRSKNIILLVIAALVTGSGLQAETVKALFLGHDQKHHNSRKNHRMLIPEFLRRGIQMDYTEDVKDLNQSKLSKYDVLIIYANHNKISPQQETDLIQFVESGKGFVPLHCASACFGHSDKFVSLVGGRFWKHGKEWFTCDHVKGKESHPVLKDVPQFETMDETYEHKDLNPDRIDLQFRIKGDHKEPWTWIRNQGKGKVFYTAYGHDGPVWEDPNYHRLVANGVIWASGKSNIKPLKNYPEFQYTPDKEGFLTNYERRRNRHNKRQKPLTPEESALFNVLPEGFEAQLFAHEPDIINPIDMAWDDRGRLFVAETVDYPNDMQKMGAGNDRIKICEDTDGDGKADKFTIFAEGLSIPTSICFSDGGIIVAHAPVFLFLKDTNGDDKADVIKEINEGWGIGDTHAGPSNLNYGLDNKIYGAIGYSGGPNKVKMGIFSMDADGKNIENITNFNNNTWGLGISEDFELFGSTANRNPAFHAAIPYRYYENAGIPRKKANLIFDDTDFYPLIATRQVDAFGMYTAGTGFNFYTARTYPEKYWNKAAFIGGPSGRLMGQFFIQEDGSSYKAVNGQNLMASFDQYTSPIQAKTGPDGQVWLLDWSNLIIQHNPTPSLERGGFKSHNGRGNAHWNPLRDKQHGRIYRVVYKGGQPSKVLDLSKADTATLVNTLKNDNMFWRTTAQRKIVQENRKDAIPLLVELAKDSSVDNTGLNAAVIHALWSLHGLGALKEKSSEAFKVAAKALNHKSDGVRKNAVRVLPPTAESVLAVVESGILKDKNLNVRRNAFLEVSLMPTSKDAAQQLISQMEEVKKDQWLKDSWLIALSRHNDGIIDSIIATLPPRDKSKEKSTKELPNLFPSNSFEQVSNGLPSGWHKQVYSGKSDISMDSKNVRTGKMSVKISSQNGSDTGLKIFKDLGPGVYRLSGWAKTENVRDVSRTGACLNIEADADKVITGDVKGSSDWKYLEVIFSLKKAQRVGFNCLFGGWGGAKGTAWFDDVKLERMEGNSTTDKWQFLSSIATNYLKRNPSDVIRVSEKLINVDSDVASVFLQGVSQIKYPELNDNQLASLKSTAGQLAEKNRAFLSRFAKNSGKDLGMAVNEEAVKAFEAEILKGNAAKGKELAATCIGCHGTDLNGDDGRKSPALAAQHDWYLITQMQKYKHGLRGGDVEDVNAIAMSEVTSKLSSQQMADIVAFIKKEYKGKKAKNTLKGDVQKGKALFMACVACHGTEAQGNPQLKSPRLAGLQDWYIFESLKKFKSGERGSGTGDVQGKLMQASVQLLKDEQAMKDVAAYLSTLKP